jgi:3-dehydroquinate dehydratase/shikimate dehydrogenase
MHSKSPLIHNEGYRIQNLDAVYVPFQADELPVFMETAEVLRIQGLSVTIPFKQEIIPFIKRIDSSVNSIGACNTILRNPEGYWTGTNTDAPGFIAPLEKLFNKLDYKTATVIGAGGAARAVVYALKRAGCRVCILNRTPSKAEELAGFFQCFTAGFDAKGISLMEDYSDIIIQTTSVGMEPDIDSDPVPTYTFRGTETVYDIIYAPLETKFLKRAREAGCRTIQGIEMLRGQAVLQYKVFTGLDYPA